MTLCAPLEGIIAIADLLEAESGFVVPVDYKRGAAPDRSRVPLGAWPADRVQIGAQILAARAHGYNCEQGILYYHATRTRVPVVADDALFAEVRAAVATARRLAREKIAPPPLIDSPKCPRCSLVGVCLPDETTLLRERNLTRQTFDVDAADEGAASASEDVPLQSPPLVPRATEPSPRVPRVRKLLPPSDDRLPLYVQAQGARIGLSGELLEIRARDGELTTARLRETSHVCVFGSVQVTTPALASAAGTLRSRHRRIAIQLWGLALRRGLWVFRKECLRADRPVCCSREPSAASAARTSLRGR